MNTFRLTATSGGGSTGSAFVEGCEGPVLMNALAHVDPLCRVVFSESCEHHPAATPTSLQPRCDKPAWQGTSNTPSLRIANRVSIKTLQPSQTCLGTDASCTKMFRGAARWLLAGWPGRWKRALLPVSSLLFISLGASLGFPLTIQSHKSISRSRLRGGGA